MSSEAAINLDEHRHYLDDNRWGTFSTLKRHKNGSYTHQNSYKLKDLPTVVESLCLLLDHDVWITQAAFKKFNRRKVNLASVGVCWVDLDYYNLPNYASICPVDFIHDEVIELLKSNNFPLPSLILDSGQGLYLKWFIENLPSVALPRWDRFQSELNKLLTPLGADKHAKDASRVLRLENTYHQQAGKLVKVVWRNLNDDLTGIARYKFDDLCNSILPFTQQELAEQRSNKDKKSSNKLNVVVSVLSKKRTIETLNWTRLKDLQRLIELRGGDIGDGLREPLAMYLCNFYALRQAATGVPDADIWHEFMQLCKQAAPHWDHKKAVSKTKNIFDLFKKARKGETVVFAGKEYPVLYTPKNQTLIDLFNITPEEESELSTIISEVENKRRDRLRDMKRRRLKGEVSREEYLDNRKSASGVKAAQARVYKAQGKTQKWIAQQLGVNKSTVSKYLKEKFPGPSP